MELGNRFEEKLLEAACIGDEDAVCKLLEKGVNINAQNKMNGWTALHWAAKRGHTNIVSRLLHHGADKTVITKKGETAVDLAEKDDIARLFGTLLFVNKIDEKLPIVPNYMSYPSFSYKVDIDGINVPPSPFSTSISNGVSSLGNSSHNAFSGHNESDEIVVKVRVAHTSDPDFIEVELPSLDLTYSRLLRVCCEELAIDPTHVLKVRKLPDTVIRKDKDVRRFQNFQEIEVVLCNQKNLDSRFSISPFPQQTQTSPAAKPTFTNCTILY